MQATRVQTAASRLPDLCVLACVQQGLIGPLLMGDISRKSSTDFQSEPRLPPGLKNLGSSLRQGF